MNLSIPADLSIPDFLRISKLARVEAWRLHPPKAVPVFIAPVTIHDAKIIVAMELNRQVKTQNRIAKMLRNKAFKKEDHTGQRWDTRISRWVNEGGVAMDGNSATEVATEAAVEVVDTSLVDKFNELVTQAIALGHTKYKPTLKFKSKAIGQQRYDALLAVVQQGPAQAGIEESEVKKAKTKKAKTKKAKTKKAKTKKAKTKKAKAPKKARGESKTGIVAAMLSRKSGCTSAEILAATKWPAVSVPAMAKAAGLKLRKEKEKGKPTRYYGS